MSREGSAAGSSSEDPEVHSRDDVCPPTDPVERILRLGRPLPLAGGPLSFFRSRTVMPIPAATGSFAPGAVVGDFELVELLGQGGMGQVWRAHQRSLARTVAVKFIHPERVTEHQLELFAREARAGGRLAHPGIVTVFGYGQSDGLAWIAMEFVEGAWTLKDFLDEAARADEVPAGYDAHVARFVAEIAEAMQTAHDAGVIHRDLKPQNVLITSADRPKVTDFGLARIVNETALSVIHARPPTALDRLVKWTKRNPAKSAAATIVTVTFTAIGAVCVHAGVHGRSGAPKRLCRPRRRLRHLP